jgi:hypothetical protein
MGSVILASLLSEITVTIYIGRWWHPDPEAELEIGGPQDTRRGARKKTKSKQKRFGKDENVQHYEVWVGKTENKT